MTDFTIHSIDTAPADSKPQLESSLKGFGMVPNLHAVLAESPQALEAYKALGDIFTKTSLSKVEQNVVWMTINVEHECHYCVPAHTMIAKSQGVDDATIDALRAGTALPDAKLESLRQFTLQLVRGRGHVADSDVEAFLAAGYTKQNILDVVVGLSHKVISNYVNHLSQTPVDAPFKAFDWTPPSKSGVAAE